MVSVNHWSPIDVSDSHRQDRVFNQFWNELPARTASNSGAFQVHTGEEGWRIDVPLPGVDPDDVNVEVTGNTLHICVVPSSERDSNTSMSTYEQTLTVPQFLNLDKLSAAHRHGMLQLTLPLKESVKPRRIEIDRSGKDRKQSLSRWDFRRLLSSLIPRASYPRRQTRRPIMPSIRPTSLAGAVALFICLSAAQALAQPSDKRTRFTFSGPVALPGVTLPAGQYLFRIADPTSSMRVIQVLNGDGTKPYGLFFAIPAERPQASATPEVRFMETAEGMPSAIRTWWYPGERGGFEFIYPKEQARRLAEGARQPILTTHAETSTTAQTNTDDLSRLAIGGHETQLDASAAPISASPTGGAEEGQIASSSLTIPTPAMPALPPASTRGSETVASQPRRSELPRTASEVPLVAGMGALALVSAASMRLVGRMRSS